ncbi:MAG: 4Fe-4S dicluster domain-containing protein, partial [Gemmataceae bacterium]|nr:4Fe-4S dicluster domain-containing protein [Gemmataceae bacterium]
SEGTLAIFTEATLRTIPLPGGRSGVLLGFAGLEAALKATERILATGPAACELLDRRLLTLARGNEAGDIAAAIDAAVEAVVLVAYETDTSAAAQRQVRDLTEALARGPEPPLQIIAAVSDAEQARLWRLREGALPSLYGAKHGPQPVPFIEDVGVPVAALPEFLTRTQAALKEVEVTASFLIHAGTGQVHVRPFLDLGKQADVARLVPLAERVHGLTLELGGTVSAQHGTGLARTPWVARQFGPLYPLLRQIKAIFDPRGIFNPGKIVDPDPDAAAWPLRQAALGAPPAPRLRWQPLELAVEANHCNGCGHCLTEAPPLRMCPIFRATHDEAATPRAKANLLRQLLHDKAVSLTLASDEVRAVADLCVNCKMCAVECPAHVNVPKLMLEAKAANVAQHGLDRGRWFLARLQRAAQWGSSMPLLINALLQSRLGRWLFGWWFHLAAERRLPRFAPRTFLWLAERRGWTQKPSGKKPAAALFVDLYANHFEPSVAEAATRVVQHQGYDVYVPPDQVSCGMEALAQGDVDTARELATRNLRAFAEIARQGMPIICLEPTTALMLRQDSLQIIDDVDATAVAAQAVEFTTFLDQLRRRGQLRDRWQRFEATIGYHVPCHMKALGDPVKGPDLLASVPGLSVHKLDVGCSGMAGTFGLLKRNYAASLAAGRPLLDALRGLNLTGAAAECSACRLQIEHAGGKRSLHPAQYLAIAYGLMPELADRLKQPFRSLVL